ncbi:MAG: 2-oxo acid dehydrogenase subunit E2 [Caldilineaceae bacterium]
MARRSHRPGGGHGRRDLVPVVRDAHVRSVGQIAAQTADLIARLRRGGCNRMSCKGRSPSPTWACTASARSRPSSPCPNAAILGVGRIQARPVVDDQIVPAGLMALSLTFDHRVVDGGPAAQHGREFVEEPALWMFD